MDDIVIKIRKLMAIADDPNASDNEVYVAVAKAQKLMVKHNIDKALIYEKPEVEDDVITYTFDCMHPLYYRYIVMVLCKNFRCLYTYYQARQQATFCVHGLPEDIDNVKTILNKVLKFVERRLKRYIKEYKMQYKRDPYLRIAEPPADARVLKRSYVQGFAVGLKEQFEKNLLELKEEYGESTALMIVGVPEVVNTYLDNVVKPKKVNQKSYEVSQHAYNQGYDDGNKFNVT